MGRVASKTIKRYPGCSWNKSSIEDNIISYTIDPKSKDIAFYWKDDNGKKIQSIGNVKVCSITTKKTND